MKSSSLGLVGLVWVCFHRGVNLCVWKATVCTAATEDKRCYIVFTRLFLWGAFKKLIANKEAQINKTPGCTAWVQRPLTETWSQKGGPVFSRACRQCKPTALYLCTLSKTEYNKACLMKAMTYIISCWLPLKSTHAECMPSAWIWIWSISGK